MPGTTSIDAERVLVTMPPVPVTWRVSYASTTDLSGYLAGIHGRSAVEPRSEPIARTATITAAMRASSRSSRMAATDTPESSEMMGTR